MSTMQEGREGVVLSDERGTPLIWSWGGCMWFIDTTTRDLPQPTPTPLHEDLGAEADWEVQRLMARGLDDEC